MTQFKGHDWTELCGIFGLPAEDASYLPLEEKLTNLGIRLRTNGTTKEDREHLTLMREFLEALAAEAEKWEQGSYPIWRGLLAVKDDDVFLSYFRALLGFMWT